MPTSDVRKKNRGICTPKQLKNQTHREKDRKTAGMETGVHYSSKLTECKGNFVVEMTNFQHQTRLMRKSGSMVEGILRVFELSFAWLTRSISPVDMCPC